MATYNGSSGNDTYSGTFDPDEIYGNGGDDTLFGGGGQDFIDGGTGADTLDGGDGNDTINGFELAAEADTIIGGAGNDNIFAGFSDSVNGGIGGSDRLSLDFRGTAALVADFSAVADGGIIVVGGATIQGVEYLQKLYLGDGDDIVTTARDKPGFGINETFGYGGNDRLTGGVGTNYLFGGEGNDQLFGLADGDYLLGETGDDWLEGGPGDDQLFGGDGIDTAVYASASAGVTVNLALEVQAQETIGAGIDALLWFENLVGSAFGDTLTGDAAANSLFGGAGNDRLDGSAGMDTLRGGTGDDTYIIDDGDDVITELADEGVDRVDARALAHTLAANVEILRFVGTGDFTGTGNALANTITGGAGEDVLFGAGGSDTLNGEADDDYLDGGAGTDTLNGGDGRDTINGVEFAAEADVINGGAGPDRIIAGWGDSVDGGPGVDTLDLDFRGTGALVADFSALAGGAAMIVGGATLQRIEYVYYLDLGDGSDTVTTGLVSPVYGFNQINGYGGNDRLTGGAGTNLLNGGEGDDRLFGLADGDVLEGNSGDDVLDGGDGNDFLSGSEGDDLLLGGGSSDFFEGDEGNDTIDGGASNDLMYGGTGNDILIGGANNDALYGDDGIDTASYRTATAGVHVLLTLTAPQDTLGAGSDMLTLIENLEGSAFDDTLTGNDGGNVLTGLAGDDVLSGGIGNDTLNGGSGLDTMTGGVGDDVYGIDSATDIVIEAAGEGTDTVRTNARALTLAANVEALTFVGTGDFTGTGNALVNTLTGGVGNDTLDGGAGVDALVGGAGDDSYAVDDSADAITELADEGTDSVTATALAYTLADNVENLSFTGAGDFTGTGNALANSIIGGEGADVLDGADGADVIRGGAGIDDLRGGAGDDAFLIDRTIDFGAGELYDGGTGSDTLLLNYNADSDISGLVLVDVEAVDQTYFSQDTRLTAAQLDTLARVSGSSFTLTTGGTVTLAGMSLNVETFVLANVVTTFDLTGSTQSYGITVTGGAAADTIIGDDAADILLGGGGNDTLTGAAESDTLDGGNGNDRMSGGTGDDLYRIDATGDRVTEAASEGYDRVETALAYRLGLNVESLTITGTAAVAGFGNTLDNAITGNAAANVLNGLDGADTLIGGGGNDTLNGGLGADALSGGLGDDVYTVDNALDSVTEAAGEGYDSVSASVDYTLGVNVERLVLTGAARVGTGNALDNAIVGGIGADTIAAGDGNDVVQGFAANDTILGGSGNDVLDGGTGRDTLTGGAGADRFTFRPGDTGATITLADRILDFSRAEGDKISLALIDAIAGTPVDDRFTFIGTTAFGNVAGQLRYEVSGNFTYIHGDTDGDAVSDLVIRLDGAVSLVAADFAL